MLGTENPDRVVEETTTPSQAILVENEQRSCSMNHRRDICANFTPS